MTCHGLRAAGLLFGFLAVATSARGQIPDSVLQRNDCRLAHQILTLGEPANQRAWALGYIDRCGELGAEAIASFIRDHRQVQEPGGELEQLVRRTRYLVSSQIFDAASDVALDAGATTVARVQAIRIVYTQLSPGSLDPYESFRDNSVVFGGTDTEAALWSKPLPRESYATTESRLRGLLQSAAPPPVQNAAKRLLASVLTHFYCGAETSMKECLDIVAQRTP